MRIRTVASSCPPSSSRRAFRTRSICGGRTLITTGRGGGKCCRMYWERCWARNPGRETKMSSTIFRELGFRFFFFSREEPRIHVHVFCSQGEAKFWIEPEIELADNYGLRSSDLQTARR